MCDCDECRECGCGVPEDHHGHDWTDDNNPDRKEWWETY